MNEFLQFGQFKNTSSNSKYSPNSKAERRIWSSKGQQEAAATVLINDGPLVAKIYLLDRG